LLSQYRPLYNTLSTTPFSRPVDSTNERKFVSPFSLVLRSWRNKQRRMTLGRSCALLYFAGAWTSSLPFILHIYFALRMHMIQSPAHLTALLPPCYTHADLCYTLHWLNLDHEIIISRTNTDGSPAHQPSRGRQPCWRSLLCLPIGSLSALPNANCSGPSVHSPLVVSYPPPKPNSDTDDRVSIERCW
jgi:hypothetical protein